MKTIFVFIFALSVSFAFGQENYLSTKDLDKSSSKTIKKAEKAFKERDYEKARKEYNKALKKHPNLIHALLRKGTMDLEEKNMNSAIANFTAATELSTSYEPRALSTLAAIYEEKSDYTNALKYYRLYKNELDDEKKIEKIEEKIRLSLVRDSLVKNRVPFESIRLGENINTEGPEYLPALSADGATLIFARVIGGQEDFYISSFDGEGYTLALPMDDLNTAQNEAAHSLSADGKVIVFTACDRQLGKGSCDLYYSVKTDKGWSYEKNLGHLINSEDWDSQPSLAADGKTIYFSSKRPGGMGAADLYYSTLKDRVWSTPVLMPDHINTKGNEMSPFIHADGRTLYFKSDHHPGMGSYDIFVTRKEGDTWSKPENLGYPINTKADDGALSISTDGSTAYYSSDAAASVQKSILGISKRTKRNYDIYKFDLPKKARPLPTTYIKFKVLDGLSKEAILSNLTITSLHSEKEIFNKTASANESFLTVLTRGENYSIHVNKEGYLFYSENINMVEEANFYDPIERTILLYPIPKKTEKPDPIIYDTPIVLRNIFFETASSELLQESFPEIERLKKLLEENEQIRIRIVGHTDNVGSPEYNKKLSHQRADAVKNKLIETGIAHTRLSTIGMGEEQPVASNEEEEGRRQNRRTEFVIIKN